MKDERLMVVPVFTPSHFPDRCARLLIKTSHSSTSNIIQLPNFDGNYSQWLSFKDTFEALIISNNQLTDVQTSLLAVIP